jgi:NitT/TauT family transport system permease protein
MGLDRQGSKFEAHSAAEERPAPLNSRRAAGTSYIAQRLWDTVLPPVVLLLLLVTAWEWAVWRWDIRPIVLPGPRLVTQAVQQNAVKLLRATLFSGTAAVLGFALSLVAGTVLAFAFSQSRWLRAGGYPYALFLQTVPIVAIAPLIVHWCGRGWHSIVLTAGILSLFPILSNGTAGLLSVDPDLLDLFRLHNATRWQMLWKLRWPSAVPALCTGAKTSCGLAVVGAIVGEYFVGYGSRSFGLGYLILFAVDQLRMAELFAAVLASTGLTVMMFATVSLATSAILARWYDAVQG